MKWLYFILLLMVAMLVCFAKNEQQTVISEIYSLDGDFDKIRASEHIQFELTHVNSEPSVIIETEQWLHTGQYITVTTRPNDYLDIKLASGTNYPAIKVYVNYRKALLSLEIDGMSSMRSRNVIFSNPSSLLNIAHSGAGSAILKLQHGSNINVAISGTGQLSLSGRVQGNGRLSVSGTAHLDAIECPMNIATAEVAGSGSASVYGVKGVHATVSGVGNICYRGPLLSQVISGLGSIKECIVEGTPAEPQQTATEPQQTSTEPQNSSSQSDKIMDRNQRLLVILATTVFFLFF
ncbi:unnamed protein product [Rotaria socialis]|uniref:Putative auto-transporter adhesin head GIN domain-containing protein n=1 Tax=Rotaria socialis TaxID=392032 RepID=A0A817TB52_9BILA|nr:unnamed protein product [Rotaria socialis]CAF4525929.1 unnamed protein product [Rotaria socialis]